MPSPAGSRPGQELRRRHSAPHTVPLHPARHAPSWPRRARPPSRPAAAAQQASSRRPAGQPPPPSRPAAAAHAWRRWPPGRCPRSEPAPRAPPPPASAASASPPAAPRAPPAARQGGPLGGSGPGLTPPALHAASSQLAEATHAGSQAPSGRPWPRPQRRRPHRLGLVVLLCGQPRLQLGLAPLGVAQRLLQPRQLVVDLQAGGEQGGWRRGVERPAAGRQPRAGSVHRPGRGQPWRMRTLTEASAGKDQK
jgi:hypothetical protein